MTQDLSQLRTRCLQDKKRGCPMCGAKAKASRVIRLYSQTVLPIDSAERENLERMLATQRESAQKALQQRTEAEHRIAILEAQRQQLEKQLQDLAYVRHSLDGGAVLTLTLTPSLGSTVNERIVAAVATMPAPTVTPLPVASPVVAGTPSKPRILPHWASQQQPTRYAASQSSRSSSTTTTTASATRRTHSLATSTTSTSSSTSASARCLSVPATMPAHHRFTASQPQHPAMAVPAVPASAGSTAVPLFSRPHIIHIRGARVLALCPPLGCAIVTANRGTQHGVHKISLLQPHTPPEFVHLHDDTVRHITCCATVANSRSLLLLSCSADRTLRITNMQSNRLVLRYTLAGSPSTCAWSDFDEHTVFCALHVRLCWNCWYCWC